MLKNFRSTLSTPSYQLIIQTALKNWILISLNIITNLLGVFFEGTTLGIIYVAISLLSEGSEVLEKIPFVADFVREIGLNNQLLFLGMLVVAVIFQCLLAASKYFNNLSVAFLSAEVQPQVVGRVFRQIMSLSFSCASRYKVGDLVYYANASGGTVNRQIRIVNNFFISFSFAIVYTFILVQLSSLLALIAIILALSIIAIQRYILPQLKKIARQVVASQVKLSEKMTENIQALRLVHTFGTQEHAISQTDSALIKTRNALFKRGIFFYLSEPFLDVMPIVALASLAAIAYYVDPDSETVLPLLLTFLVTLQRLAMRFRGVSSAVTDMIDASATMRRLDEILSSDDKEFTVLGHDSFSHIETALELRHISLAYNSNDGPVIDKLHLTIPKNKVTALVGESGAGKSSIVDLIIGLYQPTAGDVIVNDQSIYEFKQSEWRSKIGVVSQDTVVFNMSILDNLRYGAPDATLEEVIEITKAAQAHKFITDLPMGYDTIVGERGYRLSGGQRQRLALARALIKDPEILILDEATSALDSQSERLIQEALDKFQENRMVIVIAHRLSTIVNADQIVVLERGKVIELGNHEELLEKGGHYAKAWNIQTTTVPG
ncbi:Xenobiotic-transporting ATPase [[Leptolyngbya] sp. PCC 7376]|uniref:ABC transporter ATP-binding protein n=1 Tax=[Leptolyngbya] sp. PCC 7376 TaxID=111781 RepID=UPI00029F40C7|nr:ABC transporter ATP-binding protein [[Leptolyngbya] sp. PCC 7376]AFY38554.1 Xenobiotic-transporting ATPase [[Leptolyngbya] sp. PCC 7376]